MNNSFTSISKRTVAVAGVTSLVLGAGIAGAVGTGRMDLSGHGEAARHDGDQTSTIKSQIKGGRADNVILLIGDGMGDSEITIARNYEHGAGGRFRGIDALPLTGQYTTYSLTKDGETDYVPDSAATGSAWATGTKTYDNAISVDIRGTAQPTLLELAKKRGLKTGNVSTAELQDVTPAVQVAHISARKCYGPVGPAANCSEAALENGGLGSITEQLINTRPDVSLGGGAATFSEVAKGGKFKDVGPAATVGGSKLPGATCSDNPDRPANQPTLKGMTKKAIKLLDSKESKGFFLQVEGASIDKQDHAANACDQIGETVDLDEAVKAALAFAKKDRHATVIVTADHAHSSQIIEAGSTSPGLSTLDPSSASPTTARRPPTWSG